MKIITKLILCCYAISLFYSCKKTTSTEVAQTVTPVVTPHINIILTCFADGGGGVLQVMDTTGKVIYKKNTSVPVWNFQQWKYEDKTRYSYVEKRPGSVIKGLGHFPGTHVILDENLNEINRFDLMPNRDSNIYSPDAYDGHDFILLNDDHYIAIAYIEKMVFNIPSLIKSGLGCKVITALIQEVQNGKVIWNWEASDYPEFYSNSIEGNNFADTTALHDYIHINAIFVDKKDQNLIVSFRNQNQIVKLDRITGEIKWRLGGLNSDFVMTSEMNFIRQHHVTFTDNGNTLLLVDNGEATERNYSRIDEFQLNEANKMITNFSTYDVPGGYFIQYTGSVQKFGDFYLIGCGTAGRVIYANYKSDKVIFNVATTNNSYRALRY